MAANHKKSICIFPCASPYFIVSLSVLRREVTAHNIMLYFCRYEFGSAIFIAWAGAFLDIMGGGMLAASCPKGKPSPKYPKSSRPPSSSKEYVWAASVFLKLKKSKTNHGAWVEVSLVRWSEICYDCNFFYCGWLRIEQTAQISVPGQLLLVLDTAAHLRKKGHFCFYFFW